MVMLPLFVINLDRAPERWAAIEEGAKMSDVQVIRIAAVDGRAMPEAADGRVDVSTFRRRCGRLPLPGEIGCFLSHRAALETFLKSGAANGVILEDDIIITPDSVDRVNAIAAMGASFDIIKLTNHRNSAFIGKWTSAKGDRLGRSLVGPNGSAAAYMVSRAGAKRLLQTMDKLTLPYDVDLERAWVRGQNLVTVRNNVFAFSDFRAQSSIASRREYKEVKDFILRRIPTALFRTAEVFRRFAYSGKVVLK